MCKQRFIFTRGGDSRRSDTPHPPRARSRSCGSTVSASSPALRPARGRAFRDGQGRTQAVHDREHQRRGRAAASARENARSSDGKFGTQARDEADIELITPAGDRLIPIELEPGEEEYGFPDVVSATVMDQVSVYRDEDGAYTVTGSQGFRYSEWAPGDPEDEEGREAWGERNQVIIDAVIEERYPGAAVNSDGDEAQVRFEYELGDGPITEEDLVNAMSTGSAVDFYNEADDGTYGTENLSRIIRDQVARSAVVDDPYAFGIHTEVRRIRASGLVHQEPLAGHATDARAMAVAAEAAHHGDYPQLRQLYARGWADHGRMLEEIDDAHAAGTITDGAKQAMLIWLREHAPKG